MVRKVAVLLAFTLLFAGCSSISQEDYNFLKSENSELQAEVNLVNETNSDLCSKQSAIDEENDRLKSENSDLINENQKLQNELSDLRKNVADWLTYSQMQKEIEQAQAETDKINAEAEKVEAELRLKTANEELSQAEAEEQRKLTEGTTIYEDEYVKINYYGTQKEHNYSSAECCVVFLIENKTDGIILFNSDCLSINGMDLGYISMSDRVSPQSKGKIYAQPNENIDGITVNSISGEITVIDPYGEFLLKSWDSYDVKFVNIIVS